MVDKKTITSTSDESPANEAPLERRVTDNPFKGGTISGEKMTSQSNHPSLIPSTAPTRLSQIRGELLIEPPISSITPVVLPTEQIPIWDDINNSTESYTHIKKVQHD